MIALLFALATATGSVPAPDPAAPAAAAPTTVAPVAVKRGSRNDPNRRVCKEVPRPQSRFFDRVCATQAEWNEREIQDKEFLNQAQGRTEPARPPGGGR